jgi:uncharacterized repeat protein (TIGR02543 family)
MSPHLALRVSLIVGVVAATVALQVILAAPAEAATVTVTVGGVTYQANDAAIPAGATAVSYSGSPAAVTIPDHVTIGSTSYAVTAIGANAFGSSSALTSVIIPSTVVTIGSYAFTNDNHVTSITIPDSVTSIGDWAFDSMNLTSLTIGSGLTAIGTQVFSNNNHLLSVAIPSSVTSIAFAAFAADDLRTLAIGTGVTTIGVSAFAYNNRLSTVTIPASVTSMGNAVFQNNSSGITFTATFEGAAPTIGTNDFSVANPTIVYRWRFGSPQTAGGYTAPTWKGIASRALATVGFDANGHGTAPASQDVAVSSAAAAPTSPSASGYSFGGWFTAASAGTAWAFATPVTTDLTLYAHWSTAAAPASGPSPSLAATGVDPGMPFAATLLALLAGATLLIYRRSTGPRRARDPR